jgi:hypothetical protein
MNSDPKKVKDISLSLTLVGIGIALLHLLGGFRADSSTWGYHQIGFWGMSWTFLIPGLMILMTFRPVQDFLIRHLNRMEKISDKLSRRSQFAVGSVCIIFFTFICWFFRERLYFLGDGFLFIRSLANVGSVNEIAGSFKDEPLAACLAWHINRIFSNNEILHSEEHAFQILSILSGAGFLLILFFFVRDLVATTSERLLIALLVLSAGGIQLFFGYVETYALSYFLFLAFIFFSIRYLKKECTLVVPAIVFGLLFTSYFGMIAIAPVFCFLAFVELKRHKPVSLLIAIVSMLTVMAVVLGYVGCTFESFFGLVSAGGSHFLPISNVSKYFQSYLLFSKEHLTDLFNLQLLLAPFSIILVLLLFIFKCDIEEREKITLPFFIILFICCLIFTSILNTELGTSRDWDLFAPLFLGILIPPIILWDYARIDTRVKNRMLVMMTGIMILHTAPWIALNADHERSFRRFLVLQDPRYWSRHAVVDANEELGVYFRLQNDYPNAICFMHRAAVADSTHSRLWSSLGHLYVLTNKPDSAIECFKTSIHFDSTRWSEYVMLGAVYSTMHRYDEAITITKKAIRLSPDSAIPYDNIGVYICQWKQAYKEALPYFLRATELDTTDPQCFYDLALCYNALGEVPFMKRYFERFLELEPNSERADRVRQVLQTHPPP